MSQSSSTSNQNPALLCNVDSPIASSTPSLGRVLLVGPLARQLTSPDVTSDTAESLLDAIFPAARTPYGFIVVTASGESQLNRGLEALRKTASAARIILVGEPADERACRRALSAGLADDYDIWPVTIDKILRQTPAAPVPQVRAHPIVPADPVVMSVLQLPVQLHTIMTDDLLAGRGNIAERGLTLLQSAVDWPGMLRYDIGEQTPDTEHPSASVAAGNVIFGRLVLVAPLPMDDQTLGLLNQAAAWLGGWLGLSRRQEQLRTLAITDELSGAYNRRYFTRFVTGLLNKARTERFRVSVLLFDIDNFKHYNDTFGHAAGDAIVRELICLLKRCTRQQDLVARLGGDEFAVVFWDHDAPRQPNSQHPTSVKAATERFRKAVNECEWSKCARIKGSVSISGGIATFPWDGDTLEHLMEKADQALLRAKSQGKNVILLTEPKDTKPAE